MSDQASASSEFCGSCGARLPETRSALSPLEMMASTETHNGTAELAGNSVDDLKPGASEFCGSCGARFPSPPQVQGTQVTASTSVHDRLLKVAAGGLGVTAVFIIVGSILASAIAAFCWFLMQTAFNVISGGVNG